jgi:hypothetical protein
VKAATVTVTQLYRIVVVLMQWMVIASSVKRLAKLQFMTAGIVKELDR